jgi:hypothetical protein
MRGKIPKTPGCPGWHPATRAEPENIFISLINVRLNFWVIKLNPAGLKTK